MKPYPPPIHEDCGDKKSREATRREILTILCALLALALSPFVYYLFFDMPPKFSLELTEAQGLDMAAPAESLSTVFNITLHASNKRGPYTCYRHGEAVVRYSGFTLAWGRTRAFCLGAKDTRDVTVVAWADGVGLPKLIRDRMAAEQRLGSVELEVDIRLFAEEDSSGAEPTWMWCKVTTDGAEPSEATPCTVFALQNWASDIAPHWIQ